MKRIFAILAITFLIVTGVFWLNLSLFIRTPAGETEQSLTIERGTPVDTIIRELALRGVIANAPFFKLYLLLQGAAPKIRAGDYRFPPQIEPREVLAMLLKGDFSKHRLTIPEGWTAKEIAQALASQGLADADLFLKKCIDPELIHSLGLSGTSLEGYLYPDTYEIYKPKDESEIIQKMVGHFQEIYKEFAARTLEAGLSREEVVTLASIIEKETARPEERPVIASVLWNRLKKGIPLAVDPTVIYGIADFSGNLTQTDLSQPGPYNTYLNIGLPPTPISNPGKDSIRAVLYPAATDYLYFVSKNDGTHHFSESAEEHTEAVRKYQREKRP